MTHPVRYEVVNLGLLFAVCIAVALVFGVEAALAGAVAFLVSRNLALAAVLSKTLDALVESVR